VAAQQRLAPGEPPRDRAGRRECAIAIDERGGGGEARGVVGEPFRADEAARRRTLRGRLAAAGRSGRQQRDGEERRPDQASARPRRRRSAAPAMPKPSIIVAQVAGSGTGGENAATICDEVKL